MHLCRCVRRLQISLWFAYSCLCSHTYIYIYIFIYTYPSIIQCLIYTFLIFTIKLLMISVFYAYFLLIGFKSLKFVNFNWENKKIGEDEMPTYFANKNLFLWTWILTSFYYNNYFFYPILFYFFILILYFILFQFVRVLYYLSFLNFFLFTLL